MAHNGKYRVLVLTSDPNTIDKVTAIANTAFANVTVIFWEFGNVATKGDVIKQMEACDFNLLISYINGIIFKHHHLARASWGAINVHPSPPEQPGCWGIWCAPVIRRDIRTHHDVTVHEIDEDIDHGPIYMVERWEVAPTDSIQDVEHRSDEVCMKMYEAVVARLAESTNGTACFERLDEAWNPATGNFRPEDVRDWFSKLDPAHPAHQERVWLNHPNAIYSPPYFSDLD